MESGKGLAESGHDDDSDGSWEDVDHGGEGDEGDSHSTTEEEELKSDIEMDEDLERMKDEERDRCKKFKSSSGNQNSKFELTMAIQRRTTQNRNRLIKSNQRLHRAMVIRDKATEKLAQISRRFKKGAA